MAGDQYSLIENVGDLTDGAKIIIVSSTGSKALGATQNDNNRAAADVTISSDVIEPGEDVQIITLEASSSNWKLCVGEDKYLYAASSSKNNLKTASAETAGTNGVWAISFSGNEAVIKAQGSNTRNLIRYNSTSTLFSCYASGQAAVSIYKYIDAPASVAKPTFTPETAEFENEVSVSLACETEGAEIFYTLDGTAPTAESAKYEAAFKLTKTTTVKAIAIKGEDKSAVATKVYTKALPTVLPDTITCELAAELALAGRTDNVIVKGYVVAIQDAWNSQHKNVSFWMADTKDGSNTFEAYRVACETAEEAPAVGDLVWAKGTLTKYNSTPETAQGGTFGILEKDMVPAVNLGAKTIEEFLALKNKKDTCILTGVVENIKMDSKDNTQYNAYGNFDLRDETGKVYIYGLLTADGESKKFIEMNINEGDELTVLAIYAEYNGTPQVNDAIFVSVDRVPTAIDNTAVETKTFKTFENGQLVIIKNGIKYNATGAVIR